MEEDGGGVGEVSSGDLREASWVRLGDGRSGWAEERKDGARTQREVWMDEGGRDSSSSSSSERKILTVPSIKPPGSRV